jgi:tetratricopeptide (TPR) repeat protein
MRKIQYETRSLSRPKHTPVLLPAICVLAVALGVWVGFQLFPRATYQLAVYEIQAGKIDSATRHLDLLPADYLDTKNWKLFLQGEIALKEKNFDAAISLFLQNNSPQALERMHAAQLLQIDEALNGGDLLLSESLLRKVGNIPGAWERTGRFRYLLAKEYQLNKRYEAALDLLNTLRGYEDAEQLAQDATFQLALGKFEDGLYEQAATLFYALGTYTGAHDAYLESLYQRVLNLPLGDIITKKEILSILAQEDYKDAVERLAILSMDPEHPSTPPILPTTPPEKPNLEIVPLAASGQWIYVINSLSGSLETQYSVIGISIYQNNPAPAFPDISGYEPMLLRSTTDGALLLTKEGRVFSTQGSRFSGVNAWNDMVQIEIGEGFVFGLTTQGTTKLVGAISGENGDIEEVSWENITAISAGNDHVLGLCADGSVLAAGKNRAGCTDVAGFSEITAIVAGAYHSVGLRQDGSVVAVGDNLFGQAEVKRFQDIVYVYACLDRTIAMQRDGSFLDTRYTESPPEYPLFSSVFPIQNGFLLLQGGTGAFSLVGGVENELETVLSIMVQSGDVHFRR